MTTEYILGFIGGLSLGIIFAQIINIHWYIFSMRELEDYEPDAPGE